MFAPRPEIAQASGLIASSVASVAARQDGDKDAAAAAASSAEIKNQYYL